MNNTLFNNHQLINNSNQYFFEKKYISINSEDRDITKYPNPAEFEMLLPQEYLNIASARLQSWSFPANYDVFSESYFNILVLHQNKYKGNAVGASKRNCILESAIPPWLNLVIWGHEHECIPRVVTCE